MLSVGQVLKSISNSPEPQTPSSAWLNWLSCFADAGDLITSDLVNQFFQDCLQFPHWQQQARTLGDQIRRQLENLCLTLDEYFEFDEVQWPENMQLIEIKNSKDWTQVIEKHFLAEKTKDTVKLAFDPLLQKLLAFHLSTEGALKIQEFGKQFFIHEGRLIPLRNDLVIDFDAGLSLRKEVYHKMDCGNFMSCRFVIEELQGHNLIHGMISRGFDFVCFQEIHAGKLEDNAKIFYTLQRLEQHFLKKDSNPFYNSVISSVEHFLKMMQLKDPSALQKAPHILSMAQNALDYVFVGDKLLNLLIRDLQHTMAPLLIQNMPTEVKVTETSLKKRVRSSDLSH